MIDLILLAHDCEGDLVARHHLADLHHELLVVLDGGAVNLQYDVPSLEPGLLGGGIAHDVTDYRALLSLDSVGLGELLGQRLNGDPEPTPSHLAELDEVAHHLLGHVDRDGEPDALTVSDNRSIYPDNFAFQVKKRPSAVSRIDGSVSLDEVVIRPGADDAPLRAHNSLGDGLLKTERVPDSQDPLAHPELFGVSEVGHRQAVGRINLDQGYV